MAQGSFSLVKFYKMREKGKNYEGKKVLWIALFVISSATFLILALLFFWPWGFYLWMFIFNILGLYLLVRWNARNTAYICPKCGHRFMISTWRDFISPHVWNKKLLRCPACQEKNWCRAVSAEELT